jgi:hypothetical protein
LVKALDAALSPGLDIIAVQVAAPGMSGLPDQIQASHWRVELPGVEPAAAAAAVAAFISASEVMVERMTKQGRRTFDSRSAVVKIECADPGTSERSAGPCAILELVVRQGTPTVRPDDVLTGLRVVADLEPPVPPRATRLAQGTLTAHGEIIDPLLAVDQAAIGLPSA